MLRFLASRNCLRTIGSNCASAKYNSFSTAVDPRRDTAIDTGTVKSYKEIPGPKGLGIRNIINILRDYEAVIGQLHHAIRYVFREYGPIVKTHNAGIPFVLVSDPNDVELVCRAEGKYPQRMNATPWIVYRQQRNLPLGLALSDGEYWQEMRTAFNQRMFNLKHVHSYVPVMNDAVDDFVSHLLRIRGKHGVKNEIDGFENETFRYSVETILGIIFDRRMGCMDDPPSAIGEKFYKTVAEMFHMSAALVPLPPYYKYIKTKYWKKFCNLWDIIYELAEDIIEERRNELKAADKSIDDNEDVDFLTAILQTSNLSADRINSALIEMMVAAADTVAHSMTWTLVMLSRFPKAQERLYHELNNVLKGKHLVDAETVQNIPYLKACIKESMRMCPVIINHSRTLAEDVVLSGYQVPAGTTIMICLDEMFHNESLFPDPETYKPDRWLTADGNLERYGFKFLPFGYGPRMCIGRRIAELELQLLLARLVQKFTIGCNNADEINPRLKLTVSPDRPVKLTLTERNGESQ